MYLRTERDGKQGVARTERVEVQCRHDLPLHEQLEIVAATGLVNSVDALRILDVLDEIPQLAGGITRQPGEARFLPETGQKVLVAGMAVAVAAGTGWPHGVPGHDMDVDGGVTERCAALCKRRLALGTAARGSGVRGSVSARPRPGFEKALGHRRRRSKKRVLDGLQNLGSSGLAAEDWMNSKSPG